MSRSSLEGMGLFPPRPPPLPPRAPRPPRPPGPPRLGDFAKSRRVPLALPIPRGLRLNLSTRPPELKNEQNNYYLTILDRFKESLEITFFSSC